MRVLGESWCFCNGGGKSERMKAAIFSGKAPAMARINGGGTGLLIHRNLLLTTHANLPSVAAVEAAEIRLHNELSASLFPHRFFITSSVHDLTMVGLDTMDGESNAPELTVGEGKVVIATDNLIKLSTDGIAWSPGSAGFDIHGNLAFMHWEGNLDELNKPKLPLIRLMSSGQKSEHSCASFTMRQVFKSTECDENEGTPTSSNVISRPIEQLGPSSANVYASQDENLTGDPQGATHLPGILTPEIYESPMLTSVPVRKKDITQIQLLDINFPPRINRNMLSPRKMLPTCDQNYVKDFLLQKRAEGEQHCDREPTAPVPDAESTGSVNGAQSEIKSTSSHVDILELPNEYYSSEGETTMYSAETAESRNFPSPREGRFHQVGRSQSCVNYNRWGPAQKNPVGHGAMQEKHRNFARGRKVYSHGATSHRSNDYYSPTVSSIMKKRNNLEQPNRPRQSSVHTSPRWNF
ncbi:hypothetical protein DH2020_024470 [Rehmannia glutinosa]|uniref:Uncharacterized protein n=1 Tax=Rehmannia glutinosa TaxID=99300 RepID=A0ABR0W6R3_REHGL